MVVRTSGGMHRAKSPTFGYSGKHTRSPGAHRLRGSGQGQIRVASLLDPVRAGLLGRGKGYLSRKTTRSDIWNYNPVGARSSGTYKSSRQPAFMGIFAGWT